MGAIRILSSALLLIVRDNIYFLEASPSYLIQEWAYLRFLFVTKIPEFFKEKENQNHSISIIYEYNKKCHIGTQ